MKQADCVLDTKVKLNMRTQHGYVSVKGKVTKGDLPNGKVEIEVTNVLDGNTAKGWSHGSHHEVSAGQLSRA